MAPISTKLHGVGDIAGAALALSAPRLLPIRDRRAQVLAAFTGGGMLANGALTDYEFGLRRRLPMSTHLLVDAIAGGLMLVAADSLRRSRRTRAADWLPHLVLGASQIAGAALTERHVHPNLRAQYEPSAAKGTSAPQRQAAPLPSAEGRVSDSSFAAAHTPVDAGPPLAPPPLDTLVAQEEAAAAVEAAAIGGSVTHDSEDPAMDPVYQAGGGEQDGWEAVEDELIENATHGDGYGQPEHDAFTPERESDRSSAVYGESDHIAASEVVEDPAARPDAPGAGPGIAPDRG